MTTTTEAGATTPAAGRRVTPTGRLILPADADRAHWLTARRSGLGSSDVAAILGISRYGYDGDYSSHSLQFGAALGYRF